MEPITPRQFLEQHPDRAWLEIHWTKRVPNLEHWLKERGLVAFPVGWPDKTGKITPFALWVVQA